MLLSCVHCGDYVLSSHEEFDARLRLASHERQLGIQCYRCNEEARIVGDQGSPEPEQSSAEYFVGFTPITKGRT